MIVEKTENQLKHGKTAKLKADQNRVAVLELRQKGYTYRQIADELGISKSRAHQYVKKEFKSLKETHQELIDRYLYAELERLDVATEIVMKRLLEGDTSVVSHLVKIMDRRARFLGLDAPKKQDVEGKLTLENFIVESFKNLSSGEDLNL